MDGEAAGDGRRDLQYDGMLLAAVPSRENMAGDVVLALAGGAGGGLRAQPRLPDRLSNPGVGDRSLILTDLHHFTARFHAGRKIAH